MFKIGDLIVYGNIGVCKVVAIGEPPFSGASKDTDYYTLAPYYSQKSVIFTPCDNDKIVMRPVMSMQEAKTLVNQISDIGLITITDEKKREDVYKETMRSCNCRSIVSLLKTIYARKQKRLEEGKKVTASDEKYFQMAEEKLYTELAVALDMERDMVKKFISTVAETAV